MSCGCRLKHEGRAEGDTETKLWIERSISGGASVAVSAAVRFVGTCLTFWVCALSVMTIPFGSADILSVLNSLEWPAAALAVNRLINLLRTAPELGLASPNPVPDPPPPPLPPHPLASTL